METKIAEMAMKSQMDSMKKNFTAGMQTSNSSGGGEAINWSQFNFPPLIKVMHKDFSEIKDDAKRRLCKMIYVQFLMIVLILIINFVNQIIEVSLGFPGLQIFYSILQMFIFIPLQMYTFYRGYRGVASDSHLIKFYMILQVLLMIAYLIFSIVNGANFDGWVRVHDIFEASKIKEAWVICGILALIQNIFYYVAIGLGSYCIYAAKTRYFDK